MCDLEQHGRRQVGEPFYIFGGNLKQGRRSAKWETVEKWGQSKGGSKRANSLVLYVITRIIGKAWGNVESVPRSRGQQRQIVQGWGFSVAMMEGNDWNSSAILKRAHESGLRVSGEGGQKGQSWIEGKEANSIRGNLDCGDPETTGDLLSNNPTNQPTLSVGCWSVKNWPISGNCRVLNRVSQGYLQPDHKSTIVTSSDWLAS